MTDSNDLNLSVKLESISFSREKEERVEVIPELLEDAHPAPPGIYWAKLDGWEEDPESRRRGILDIIRVNDELVEQVQSPQLISRMQQSWWNFSNGEGAEETVAVENSETFTLAFTVPVGESYERTNSLLDNIGSQWMQIRIPNEASRSERVEISTLPTILSLNLDSLLSLGAYPLATREELAQLITSLPPIRAGVAIDVGQGSATALLRANGEAVVYADIGAGKPLPPAQSFCHCSHPLIILSHFHRDHYHGAEISGYASRASWIVPARTPGPTVTKKIISWMKNGAKIFRISPRHQRYSSPTHSTTFIFQTGIGSTVNNSGLILTVKSSEGTWVFPGDCGYDYFPSIHIKKANVLMAPHHGSKASCANATISPTSKDYNRLIYSFGHNNSYGHPAVEAIDSHFLAKWTDGSKTPRPSVLKKKDVFIFATHSRATGYSQNIQRSIGFGLNGVPDGEILEHLRKIHRLTIID